MRVIGYGLRLLIKVEKNYNFYLGKFEFFVFKWVVCEYFRDYFYYVLDFIVYIDNNFFIYVLMIVKLNVIGYCWVLEFVDFLFVIKYRFGYVNKDVDVFL